MKKIGLLIITIWGIFPVVIAQKDETSRLEALQKKLETAAETAPAFTKEIDISVTNMPIADMLKNIAKASGANLNIHAPGHQTVTCNFKKTRIIDLIYFLCKNYGFDAEIIGNIISIFPCTPDAEIPPVPDISYDDAEQTFTYELQSVRLIDAVKKISELSGINIVIPSGIYDSRISAYAHAMPTEEAIRTLGSVNAFNVKKKNNKTWIFSPETGNEENGPGRKSFGMNEITVDSSGRISADITNGNIREIIPEICEKLNLGYFVSGIMDRETAIFVNDVDFTTFLSVVFTGTEFSWRYENGVYVFGGVNTENRLSTTKVIPMKYRSVEKITEIIPAELKKNMEIIPFPDLNSIVICGEQKSLGQIESLLMEIDRSVPLILIDVIIVDATQKNVQEAGISTGLGKQTAQTSGSISPGIEMSLNANSVNKLINTFNGFGSINLGKVSPNFYLNLKFLEETGKIILRSTPRLSTLNGHKATLKSGETKYYKESQTNIIGTQNPLQTESYMWKNVEANLTLDITPYVSKDSCITLKIDITQSEFTPRESDMKDAPPGMSTRSFNSIIKVKNQDMILLGGIERNAFNSGSKGIPFLARIPVLKWLFGASVRNKSSNKLNVFIKPTIIN